MNLTSSHCNSARLVLQIVPDLPCGQMEVDGRVAPRITGMVYIPKTAPYYIHCPLNYFQESASLSGKWILDDKHNKLKLEFIDNLNEVIITQLVNNNESIINIPSDYNKRLFKYFKLDICHNTNNFKGFDCYAFISLIANVKYFPKSPEFTYEKKEPSVGDFIVLTVNDSLPDSIKHWALYLGNNRYLSKFGRSGEGAQSLLEIMDLKSMKTLYQCEFMFIAKPKIDAREWDGYPLL